MHQENLAIYLRPRVLERFKRYAAIDIQVTEKCRNMREVPDRHPDVVWKGTAAIRTAGWDVITEAIRGGTVGARLCFRGLPAPNIFASGLLFRSRQEWIPLNGSTPSAHAILELCRLWAGDASSTSAPREGGLKP